MMWKDSLQSSCLGMELLDRDSRESAVLKLLQNGWRTKLKKICKLYVINRKIASLNHMSNTIEPENFHLTWRLHAHRRLDTTTWRIDNESSFTMIYCLLHFYMTDATNDIALLMQSIRHGSSPIHRWNRQTTRPWLLNCFCFLHILL